MPPVRQAKLRAVLISVQGVTLKDNQLSSIHPSVSGSFYSGATRVLKLYGSTTLTVDFWTRSTWSFGLRVPLMSADLSFAVRRSSIE